MSATDTADTSGDVALPEFSDSAGPWLQFHDAVYRVKALRQCSEAAAEAWLHRAAVARCVRFRCLHYRWPGGCQINARVRYPNTPSMHRKHDWESPLDRLKWGPEQMREAWVRDHTEWHADKLHEALQKAPITAPAEALQKAPITAPANEKSARGRSRKWNEPPLIEAGKAWLAKQTRKPTPGELKRVLAKLAEQQNGYSPGKDKLIEWTKMIWR